MKTLAEPFLSRLLAGTGAVMAFGALPDFSLAHQHAVAQLRAGENKFAFFTPEEARQMEAVCEQIIPSDDGPGAREAGAIYFIDYALSQTEPHLQPIFRTGLKELTAACAPDKFIELGVTQQIAVLKKLEQTEFFAARPTVHHPWIPRKSDATLEIATRWVGNTLASRVRACSRILSASTMRNCCLKRKESIMATNAKFKTTDSVDFLIIGSGSAGGVLAKELSSNGFQVVVLEQGPRIEAGQFEHDEYGVFNLNVLTNNPRQQPTTFRKSENETATIKPSISYGRVVGGGSVHFTANYWRFHELDFVERSRKGSIPGADLEDWPITYNDLEPYYTKAEWELGVSGQAGASPFDPPRSKPYPLPPLPIKSSGVLMERGARKLGWHPFPAPMAIISEDYHGRRKCMNCGFCEYFGCEWGSKSSTLATVIPIAERTGRCEIRPNCYVHEIEVNAQGRVTGVVYFDKQKTLAAAKGQVGDFVRQRGGNTEIAL